MKLNLFILKIKIMWDDIVIGTGDKGCSSGVCFKIKGKHSISENNVSYWIDDLLFGCGMTIFKDTIEGQTLTNLIDSSKSVDVILTYLNSLVLKHISLDDCLSKIENIKRDSYELGRTDMKQEFRNLLDIN